jgi:2-dehydropantoate 2-reductase
MECTIGQIAIIGAGSVGLNLGARLSRSGSDVLFVVRRPEVARAIESEGVSVSDPGRGETWSAPARAVVGTGGGVLVGHVAIVCVRTPESAGIADALQRNAPGTPVVSAQNDVTNEAILAEHLEDVMGLVVRQTCTQQDDRSVRAGGSGRVIVGRHPRGVDEGVRGLAQVFERAGFDVGCSEDIAADKWLKLCVNLTSAPNALIQRSDHRDPRFAELKARLLEEARDALAAAGIPARSGDGRDRSLQEEIDATRASSADGTSFRPLPLFNAVWGALTHSGKPLEADLYHRRIIDLGRTHGVPTPVHTRTLSALLSAYEQRLGPECYDVSQISMH